MTLLINEDEVDKLITLEDCIESVESGFRQQGLGLTQSKPRREVRISGKDLPHADPRMVRIAQGLAYSDEINAAVLHHILAFPHEGIPYTRVINYLISGENGNVLAIIESKNLLMLRTGAAGAVGAKYLSRKDSKVAGIVGAGRQGRVQLKFLLKVRPIEKAFVYDQIPNYSEKYAKEMTKDLDIDIFVSETVESLFLNSDIVVTATPSTTPYVKQDWLKKGIHINIIGADDPPKIELEGTALKKADKLVLMSEESYNAGQLKKPIEQRIINKTDVYGVLGEIVAGKKPGRETEDEITIYHNPGMTLQDLMTVHKVFQKAQKLGIGKKVPDPFLLT